MSDQRQRELTKKLDVLEPDYPDIVIRDLIVRTTVSREMIADCYVPFVSAIDTLKRDSRVRNA